MLRQVSQAIFGSPDRIRYTIVPTPTGPAVESGEVDIVAETMTINCEREKDVDFSSVYFEAGQQILVPVQLEHHRAPDLGGKRVCATDGSTSLNNLVVPPVAPHVTIGPWRTKRTVW